MTRSVSVTRKTECSIFFLMKTGVSGEHMVRKAQQALPNQPLRLARKQRGWTQQEVAERIGAPLALNVMRWERGMTRPSAHYVQRLCQLFEKSAAELGLLADEDSQQEPA